MKVFCGFYHIDRLVAPFVELDESILENDECANGWKKFLLFCAVIGSDCFG